MNNNVNTKDLIEEISVNIGISKDSINSILESFQVILKRELFEGNRVKVKNIGSFIMIDKPDRVRKGFGQKFEVSASKVIKFIPSSNLKSRSSFSELNKLFDKDEQ